MADREPFDVAAGQGRQDGVHGVLVAGQHHGAGPVDGGDRHTLGQGDLVLGGLHGDHHAAGRQRLHEPAAGGDQGGRVGEREDTGQVRGGDLADRVADQVVRGDAVPGGEPVERHLDGEQRGLRVAGPFQQVRVVAPDDVAQSGEVAADLVEGLGEDREPLVQLPAHAQALGTLAGEQHRQFAAAEDTAGDQAGGGPVGDQLGERGGRVGGGDRGPVLQRGPGGGQGAGDRDRVGRAAGQQVKDAGGLGTQCGRVAAGEQPRHLVRYDGGRRGLGGRRRLLDDGVRVRAAQAERGDTEPARLVAPGPRLLLGEQPHRARGPVDVRGRGVHVQGPGQHLVAQRHDHLDDPGDAGGGLGVAQVGLDRAEQQRAFRVTATAVGGQQRLRLDRVAERGAGAVRLDRVHLVGGEPRVHQGGLDDAPL
ncbi:hypothetical protein GCM10009828_084730 [Actinoplanes couchii]